MSTQQNFFALIKDDHGDCKIKRIKVNKPLQAELIKIFEEQCVLFEKNITEEIVFNGDWNPEINEVLTLTNVKEAKIMSDAIGSNLSSFSDLIVSNFINEPIKAIFTGIKSNGTVKVLIQKFSSRQALSLSQLPIIRMQTGNTFTKTTDDIFTIDNKLVAIIENNKTKFKSFHNSRMVFDLSDFYREATDDDLIEISNHNSLEVTNKTDFVDKADMQIRKMVHAIKTLGILDTYSVNQISTAAKSVPNLIIVVKKGKIKLPNNKKELKEILHFLLENLYKGPLSGNGYLTNSKRTR